MLTIRLTRKGKKNQPFFRMVVIDKRRSSKGGRAVEELGYLDPLTKRTSLKKERILHWLKVGAKPSPTIHNLLVAEKIIDSPKIKKFSVSKKAKEEPLKVIATMAAPAEVPVAPVEVPASEAPKEEAKPSAFAEASASDESSAGQAGETKE